jgi:hypothetical protein
MMRALVLGAVLVLAAVGPDIAACAPSRDQVRAKEATPARSPESAPAGAAEHPGIAPMPHTDEAEPPHLTRELDCKNCHQSKHQGVLRMYLGRGGRGAKPVPSHMSQLRLECIACHVVAKESQETAAIVGQTFRPSDKACVGCHGEKYRGMITEWSDTLVKMRGIVAAKITTARAALLASPKHPKRAQAQKMVDDAEYNVRFVELGRGVHNVFYAADLLRLSNGWLDDAVRGIGKAAPAKTDDALVRGGYCAVLCHEPIGVKAPDVAKYGTKPFPHVRHVKEFGATCTNCHSADVHKAFAATPATCSGCHHGPQNERCEGCHKAQSAFYRGQTKAPQPIAANLMADTVACTGCHDWSKPQSVATITQKCSACHDPQYTAIVPEWTKGFAADVKKTSDAIRRAEAAVARSRVNGRARSDAETLLKQAKEAVALVQQARPAHNPLAADALLAGAREKAQEARAKSGAR